MASLVYLAGGLFLGVLAGLFLALRQLGAQDFNKIADKLASFTTACNQLLKAILVRAFGPLVLVGAFAALILSGLLFGIYIYIPQLSQRAPPTNPWDWAFLIATSELVPVLGVLVVAAAFYLIDTLTSESLSNARRGMVIAALVVLSPIALPLALYILVVLLAIVLGLGLAFVISAAVAMVILLVPSLPLKFVSLVTGRFTRNVERRAATLGILLLPASAYLLWLASRT